MFKARKWLVLGTPNDIRYRRNLYTAEKCI